MRGRGYIRGSGSNRGSGSSYRTSSSYGMNRNHSNLRQDRYSDKYGSTSSNRYNSNSYGGGHSSSTGAGTYDSRNRDKYNHNSSSSLNRYNDSSHKRHYRDSSRDRNDDRKRSRQDDYRRGSSSGRGNRTPPPPPPPHTGVTTSSSGANYRGHTSSRSHRPTTTSSRNHDNHRNEVSSNTRHSGANQMKQRPILRSGYVSRPRGNLTSSNRGIRTTYRGSAVGRLGRRDPNELRRLRRVHAIKIVRGSSSFLRNRRVARRSKSPRSSHKKNSSDDEDEDDDDAHEKTADSNKDDNEEDWDSDAKEAAAPSTGPPKKRSSSKRQKSSTDMETKTDDDDIEENDDDENQNDNDDDDDDDDDEHDDNENDDGTGDSGENRKKEVKENADESSVAAEGSKCGASTDKIKKKEPSSTKEEKPELIDIAGKPKKERLGTTSPMTKDGKAKKTSSSPSSSISKVIKNAKDTKTTSSSDKKKAKRITGTASGADKHDDDINKQTTRAPPTRLREDIRKSSRFIKLTCVHCRARCVTFKEYSYHLNSRSHKNALRQIAYRQKAHLLRLRASQRNAQREIEENAKETYESKFCHLCRLHYRQPKAKHQLSEHHKTMKKFLMPYCSPCHLAFKSPMLYETHRCSLEHIRNKARNADCDSSELSADDELGEIDLNKFLTVDSVGEIDDDEMDIDTLLAESETLESADGNRLSGANDDIKAYAPLGIQFVQKVEAIYCGLCKQHYPLTDDFDAFTKNHCQLRTHLKSYIRHKEEQRNLEKINIKEEINAAADELEKQAGEDTVKERDREAELEDDEQGISKNKIGGTVNKIDEDADEEDDDNVKHDDSKANADVDGHDAGQGEYEYVEANADDGEPSIDDITIEEEPNLEISKPHADDVKDESNTYDASSETDAANHKTWDQVDKDLGEILREIPSTDKDEEDDEDEGVLNIDIESEKPKTKELNGKNEKELKKTIKVEMQTPPKQKLQRKSTVVVAKKGDTPKKSSASPHK